MLLPLKLSHFLPIFFKSLFLDLKPISLFIFCIDFFTGKEIIVDKIPHLMIVIKCKYGRIKDDFFTCSTRLILLSSKLYDPSEK